MKIKRTFLQIVAVLILWSLPHASQAGEVQQPSDMSKEDALLSKHTEINNQATSILKPEAMWKDANNHATLLKGIELASTYRLVNSADLLVSHITFSPPGRKLRLLTNKDKYPAYAALLEIGIPAVPFLIAEIKQKAGDGSPISLTREAMRMGKYEDPNIKKHLLTSCLFEIYERGGYGALLALERIRLELHATTIKEERVCLEHSLQWLNANARYNKRLKNVDDDQADNIAQPESESQDDPKTED